jgi:hypothetical protein
LQGEALVLKLKYFELETTVDGRIAVGKMRLAGIW